MRLFAKYGDPAGRGLLPFSYGEMLTRLDWLYEPMLLGISGSLFVLMIALLVTSVAHAAPPIPTTGLIFSDDFSAFDRATPTNPKGRWQTTFSPFASQNLALGNRELQNEQEVYVEPEFGGVASLV